jgi:hypothetical protein
MPYCLRLRGVVFSHFLCCKTLQVNIMAWFHERFFSAKCEIFRMFLLNCEQSSRNNLFEWLQFKRNRRNNSHFAEKKRSWNQAFKAHTDRTRFGNDANFQFSMTFNFNIFQCFSNIRNHLSNFNYLVCISCKIFIRWRFYLFLKTENPRRVAESRPVCMGL